MICAIGLWGVWCLSFAFDSGAIPVGVLVALVCGVVGLRIALCVGSLDYAGGFGFCVAWFCVAWVGFWCFNSVDLFVLLIMIIGMFVYVLIAAMLDFCCLCLV